jgi:hypothetical protein
LRSDREALIDSQRIIGNVRSNVSSNVSRIFSILFEPRSAMSGSHMSHYIYIMLYPRYLFFGIFPDEITM